MSSNNNNGRSAADVLEQQMNALKDSFYSSEKKNAVFKKNQKEMCARSVSEQICVDDAIKTSFFTVARGDFYLNYPLMKLYLNDTNFERITDRLIEAILDTIADNGNNQIRIHVNLNGFTVSAAERYKHVLQYFSNACNDRQIVITPFVEHVFIYYTPVVMASIIDILKFCIEPEIQERFVLISKDESEHKLCELFQQAQL